MKDDAWRDIGPLLDDAIARAVDEAIVLGSHRPEPWWRRAWWSIRRRMRILWWRLTG